MEESNRVVDYRLKLSHFAPVRGLRQYIFNMDPNRLQLKNSGGEEWLAYLPSAGLLWAYNVGLGVGAFGGLLALLN